MSPIRTPKTRQNGEEPFQLTWTSPVEPASHQTISFAPNVTPVTFTAPPPSDEDAILSQPTLFPDAADFDILSTDSDFGSVAPPRKRRKGAKAADPDGNGHIPRPPNAFILFRSSFIKSQHVSSKIEGNHGTLSKIVGMLWHSLPHEERQVWQAKARKALSEHKKKYPGYSFRPSSKDKDKDKASIGGDKGGGGAGDGLDDGGTLKANFKRDASVPPISAKRKHREVGPRDVARCEQIAYLLRKGTKGKDLEEAMRAFDASRAPAVITPRFEEPITAEEFQSTKGGVTTSGNSRERDVKVKVEQMENKSFRQFRRGSSAPLLDVEQTENARKQTSFLQTRPSSPVTQVQTVVGTITQGMHSQTPIRKHRKRSASSSPPLRNRPLVPHASLPAISGNATTYANVHVTATQISLPPLNTALDFHPTQPMSAPALSRQATEYSMDGETSPSSLFFEGQATSLYDDMAASPPPEFEYSQGQGMQWSAGLDYVNTFNNFSFAPSSPIAPSPTTVSPFEHAHAHAQAQTAEEDLRLLLQVCSSPIAPHHSATTWSTSEFSYEQLPSSPTESVAAEHNAPSPVSVTTTYEYDYSGSEYDGASTFASSSGAQTPTSMYDFSMTNLAAPTPIAASVSPSPTNVSERTSSTAGTHTQLATPETSCFGTMQLAEYNSLCGTPNVGDAVNTHPFFADEKVGLGLHGIPIDYSSYMPVVSGM